jgi:hypothetical protein
VHEHWVLREPNTPFLSIPNVTTLHTTAESGREAEGVFQRRFHVSLDDLVAISEDPHWSGTQKGGNRWAQIDRVLIELRAAIDRQDEKRTAELLEQLPLMRHNTGLVGEKLKLLDAICKGRN